MTYRDIYTTDYYTMRIVCILNIMNSILQILNYHSLGLLYSYIHIYIYICIDRYGCTYGSIYIGVVFTVAFCILVTDVCRIMVTD